MMLILLFAGCVSHSTFHVTKSILTVINMTGKSVDWYSSLEEDPAAQIVGLPNKQEDEAILREPLENLGRCHSAEKHVRILLAMEAFKSLNTQDKGEHLQRQKATCHPPGIPEEVSFSMPSCSNFACRFYCIPWYFQRHRH